MTRLLRFEFPMPANIANARMHWRVKLNAKNAFYAECDRRQLLNAIPAPRPTPFLVSTAKVTMHLGAEMDDDNAGHRCKWVWDWLKTRGYIVDDKKKNLKLAGYPEQRVKRNQNYRIEVILTELPYITERSA